MSKNIWLDKNLLRSRAFRSLKKWAMLAYLDFLRKRQMESVKKGKRSDEWIIKNNGKIVYPYAEAECKGISRSQFRNAIDELIAKGFLDITHLGSGGRAGDMTMYFLDDRWKKYGTPAFKPAKNPRRKDTRKSRGWSVYHANKKKTPVSKSTPGKPVSSNKSDTPSKEITSVSSISSHTPISLKQNITAGDNEKNSFPQQMNLWSNDFDTIL